jgi:hypothetical protein
LFGEVFDGSGVGDLLPEPLAMALLMGVLARDASSIDPQPPIRATRAILGINTR